MAKSIYLVRHGEIEGDIRSYIGSTDVLLSKRGIVQAEYLKEYFSGKNIGRAYVSPLSRCIQTLEIILQGSSMENIIVENFKEINLGSWEGRPFDYIKRHFPEEYQRRGLHIDSFIPPEGESFYQLQQRVIPAFDAIANATAGNILIVAHAGVNRVILSKLLGMSLRRILDISQPYGCINELTWDEANKLWTWNLMVKG